MNVLRTTLAVAAALVIAAPTTWAQDESAAALDSNMSRQIEVTVLGMSCPFCAYGLEQKLKKLEGVEDLEVVLQTGLATMTLEDDADVSNDLLKKTVKDAGFEVAKITRNFDSEFPDFDRKP
ncbi:MAG: heavy-metal-associated domain-containing protein [Gemmatimonadales bacterium]